MDEAEGNFNEAMALAARLAEMEEAGFEAEVRHMYSTHHLPYMVIFNTVCPQDEAEMYVISVEDIATGVQKGVEKAQRLLVSVLSYVAHTHTTFHIIR